MHRAATAFSDAASVYEQARPGYPAEAVSWLVEQLALRPGRRVLDLAAGTGKLTRSLLDSGATVIAVEPVEGMRTTLARAVPGADVVAGVAQAMPLSTGSIDALTVAQAMHWFARSRRWRRCTGSCARGHRWRWCGTDATSPIPFRRRSTGSWRRCAATPPRAPRGHGAARSRAPARADAPRFAAAAQLRVPWTQFLDVDGVAGRVASVSFVAGMDSTAREELLEEVRAEARRYRAPLALPYTAELFCYRRVD